MHRIIRPVAVGLIAPCLYLGLLGIGLIDAAHGDGVATVDVTRTGPQTARVCFPSELMDRRVRQRPCYRTFGPLEDGSGRLGLGSRKGNIVVCRVPNVREEGARFAIRCRRIG